MRFPRRGIDVRSYLEALVLLVRNPQLALGPFLAAVATLGVGYGTSSQGPIGFVGTGVDALLLTLVSSFAFGFSLLIADLAWRGQRAGIRDAWLQAQRRLVDLLWAALGYTFVTAVAVELTAFIPGAPLVVEVVVRTFLVYTLAAAAIGGVPGFSSLQESVDRVRRAPPVAIVASVVQLLAASFVPSLVLNAIFTVQTTLTLGGASPIDGRFITLIAFAVGAFAQGYAALVIAKAYTDLSYGRW